MNLTYVPSRLDGVENIEGYRPGGFHPLHIGDILNEGRYRVIHKLGHGSFSTVWLARDLQQNSYVALKIAAADQILVSSELALLQYLSERSTHPGHEYLIKLLHHFTILGPNGRHQCLVLQVAGPSVKSFSEEPGKISGYRRLRPRLAHLLSRQAAEALHCLHSLGIVHADFTTANILVSMDFIQSLSEEDLAQLTGPPTKEAVHLNRSRDGDAVPPGSAPAYVVASCDFTAFFTRRRVVNAVVIDFGVSRIADSSYPSSTPTGEDLGRIPASFAAPELFFGGRGSFGADVWALACVLYAIRAGRDLFESFFGTRDEVLQQVVQALGQLPQDIWAQWSGRGQFLTEDGVFEKLPREGFPMDSLSKLVEDVGICGEEKVGDNDMSDMTITGDGLLSEEGVAQLLSCLERALKYEPKCRATVAGLLRCEWFTSSE